MFDLLIRLRVFVSMHFNNEIKRLDDSLKKDLSHYLGFCLSHAEGLDQQDCSEFSWCSLSYYNKSWHQYLSNFGTL
jgi:hypothetical protein